MTDVSVQMSAVAVCVFLGAVGGVLYECVELVRFFHKGKAVCVVCDALFFPIYAAFFILAAAFFCLPSFRIYLFAAAGLGFLLYRKSLHRILAFFACRLYNKCRKIPNQTNAGIDHERR